MQQIDDFASLLLEESKRFLEKAKEENESDPLGSPASHAYLHAALLLAFSALEAHVNAIADDFIARRELTPHELGVLQEREVRLHRGSFQVQTSLKMFRLEDRIEFLHAKFSGEPLDNTAAWWSQLDGAKKLRDQLTHPKMKIAITVESVGRAILAIVEAIDVLYRAIYKTGFPAAGLRLDSELGF